MRAIQAAHCPTTCEAIQRQSSKETKLASLNVSYLLSYISQWVRVTPRYLGGARSITRERNH